MTMNNCNADDNTPLHLAFIKGDNELADMLLTIMENSSNIQNVTNNFGLTTLHIACARDNTKVVDNLLSYAGMKDSVSTKSPMWKGFTAMHFAAEYKSLKAMKMLLAVATRSDKEKKNADGQTPLQIINHQLEDLLVMSDLLSIDTASKSYKNLSNFHVACTRDDPELVKKFLDNGAAVDTPVDKKMNTCSQYAPINFAIEAKSPENAKILIKAGANLNRKNLDGMTPLHQALYTERNGVRSPLVDALYHATRNKEANPKDNYDLNYLHIACTRDDVVLVKHLLDKNVDINSQVTCNDMTFYHFTPLHFATLYEHVETVGYLINREADVNACDDGHYGTPLLIALFFGNKLIADMLITNGGNPKAVRPTDKETALHCLVYGFMDRKEEELLEYFEKLIMEEGVDVNAKNNEGNTALHFACKELRNGAACVKSLLEFGADIDVENDKGETAFMHAMNEIYNKYSNDKAADYLMLYHHVQKMKALGLEINKKNERCCKQFMAKIDDGVAIAEHEGIEEVEGMRKVELLENLSVNDFVTLKPESYEDVAGLNFSTVAAVAKEYPIYGCLVRMRLHKIKQQVARGPEAGMQVYTPEKRQRGGE